MSSAVLPAGSSSSQSSYRLLGKIGQASPQPMLMTTSAARTTSSVQGFGYSPEMSMPRSAMASTAPGLISRPGSDPPDHATARSPARCWKNPIAICEPPALWVERTGRGAMGRRPFGPGQRPQPLAGEPFGQQRQKTDHVRPTGELVVGGVQ